MKSFKKSFALAFILLSFVILSCNKDDAPVEETPDYSFSFDHDGNTVNLNNLHYGNIINDNDEVIGKFVYGDSHFTDDPNFKNYTITLLFDTASGEYNLYAIKVVINVRRNDGSYSGRQYENNDHYTYYVDMPMSNDIQLIDGRLKGTFSAKLFDNGSWYETIENGYLDIEIPDEDSQPQ